MRSLFVLAIVALFSACSKPTPLPVIYDMVDGVVTTEVQELVPLKEYGESEGQWLLLLPVAEEGSDPALGPVSKSGRSRAVASGNYSLGFAPTTVLAPNTPQGTFTGTPAASLNKIAVTSFDESSSAEVIASRIKTDHLNEKVLLVGSTSFLEAVANSFEHVDFDWPAEGDNALVYIYSGKAKGAIQQFAVQLNRG